MHCANWSLVINLALFWKLVFTYKGIPESKARKEEKKFYEIGTRKFLVVVLIYRRKKSYFKSFGNNFGRERAQEWLFKQKSSSNMLKGLFQMCLQMPEKMQNKLVISWKTRELALVFCLLKMRNFSFEFGAMNLRQNGISSTGITSTVILARTSVDVW